MLTETIIIVENGFTNPISNRLDLNANAIEKGMDLFVHRPGMGKL